MNTPDEVKLATDSYHADQDIMSEYIADRCLLAEFCRVSRKDLFADYQKYCEQQGIKKVLDRTSFFRPNSTPSKRVGVRAAG
jgi:phage/plasmid-associated DNA primase